MSAAPVVTASAFTDASARAVLRLFPTDMTLLAVGCNSDAAFIADMLARGFIAPVGEVYSWRKRQNVQAWRVTDAGREFVAAES